MLAPGRAGLSSVTSVQADFARPGDRAAGNNLPANTGPSLNTPQTPGPGMRPGGDLGNNDGFIGADPSRPKMSPFPHVSRLGEGQESWWRGGIQGFNDKLTVRDRHAYFDTGNQSTGTTFDPATGGHNAYNDQRVHGPRPDLRIVNRSVSFQQGSDATRNQDDLTRGYSWLGEQGSGWAPVYGGVPGLYQPYGTRGGVPYPVVSPVAEGETGDGPKLVFSGPPHGLHSLTYPDGKQTLARYGAVPQMRPVRFDRPSNSPIAGQSYNQTVLPQGATMPRGGQATGVSRTTSFGSLGRGWGGAQTP